MEKKGDRQIDGQKDKLKGKSGDTPKQSQVETS